MCVCDVTLTPPLCVCVCVLVLVIDCSGSMSLSCYGCAPRISLAVDGALAVLDTLTWIDQVGVKHTIISSHVSCCIREHTQYGTTSHGIACSSRVGVWVCGHNLLFHPAHSLSASLPHHTTTPSHHHTITPTVF